MSRNNEEENSQLGGNLAVSPELLENSTYNPKRQNCTALSAVCQVPKWFLGDE